MRSVLVASGSYVPENVVKNEHFLENAFYEKDETPVKKDAATIIKKFSEITEIEERRYANPDQCASDLGFLAAKNALETSGIDKESLDYIIVAHNFGDVAYKSNRVNMVPSLASRVKYLLQVKNPDCVAYDLPFGCPGFVEAIIQANYFIQSGDVKRCLVIGSETLSRIIDPHDRDSMIYSDGAGAVILENSANQKGILSHKTQTHAIEHALILTMGRSYAPSYKHPDDLYIKMNGRKVYEFALNHVPLVIKAALDKAKVDISEINKVLIHQANGKMDSAILERVYKLFGKEVPSKNVMPMTISHFGNNSVATIPILLDLILKGKLENHSIQEGDKVILASVGAGMNINAVLYQF
jgi:3-oxoacyl-[acyl-carrier-protein] synthase-3